MIYMWHRLLDEVEEMHCKSEAVFRYTVEFGGRGRNLFLKGIKSGIASVRIAIEFTYSE